MPPALFPQPLVVDVRLRVLLMLATLSLGIVAGAWLGQSPGLTGERQPLIAEDTRDPFSARNRRLARVSPGEGPAPDVIAGASYPTRHSVQSRIDAVDPRDWLADYGTVVETPLAPR